MEIILLTKVRVYPYCSYCIMNHILYNNVGRLYACLQILKGIL